MVHAVMAVVAVVVVERRRGERRRGERDKRVRSVVTGWSLSRRGPVPCEQESLSVARYMHTKNNVESTFLGTMQACFNPFPPFSFSFNPPPSLLSLSLPLQVCSSAARAPSFPHLPASLLTQPACDVCARRQLNLKYVVCCHYVRHVIMTACVYRYLLYCHIYRYIYTYSFSV